MLKAIQCPHALTSVEEDEERPSIWRRLPLWGKCPELRVWKIVVRDLPNSQRLRGSWDRRSISDVRIPRESMWWCQVHNMFVMECDVFWIKPGKD